MNKPLIFTALLLFLLVSCDNTVHVTGLFFDKSSLTLVEGEQAPIGYRIEPADADNQNVLWTSSDNTIASVSGGFVRAISSGNTLITATTEDSRISATCQVTVEKKKYPIESVAFENSEITIRAGDTIKLAVIILPAEAANNQVIETFRDRGGSRGVLSIDENGFITGNIPGVGYVEVEVEEKESRKRFYASCKINVDYRIPEPVDLGLSVYWSSINLGAPRDAWAGPYYSWGETELKNNYTKSNYSYMTEGNGWTTFDEYIDIGSNISETKYDAAYVHLGNGWRMPLVKEFQELIEKCTWEKETIYINNTTGIVDWIGYRITGPNGNSIFMSAYSGAGRVGSFCYWSGEIYSDNSGGAFCLYASEYASNLAYIWNGERYEGNPIRPVKDK